MVLNLNVVHDCVFVQPGDYRFLGVRAREQQHVVSQVDHMNQVYDAPTVVGQDGRRSLAGAKVVHLVGGKAVEQVQTVRADGL